jgi:hypothetical protein
MRSDLVVFNPPSLGRSARIEEICKAMQVEQFVTDSTIERLHLRILGWLSRIAELQGNLLFRTPLQHRSAREFTTAIEAHGCRKTSLDIDRFENADDVASPKRKCDFNRQAFTGEVVNDDHCPNRAAKIEPVVNEIDRPTLVRTRNRRDRVAAHIPHVPLATRPNFQAQIPINPAKSLPANCDAQHDHQAAISETRRVPQLL